MQIARLAVEVEPFHLDRPFDYLIPEQWHGMVQPGVRVQVGFSGRSRRALVLEVTDHSDVDPSRLRSISKLLGDHRWVTPDELEVLRWAAQRFQGPLSDVIRHALPGRTIAVERAGVAKGWLGADAADWAVPTTGAGPTPTGLPISAPWESYGAAGQALWEAIDAASGSFYWRPKPGEVAGDRLAELASLARAAGRGVLLLVPDPASQTADLVVAAMREAEHEVVDLRGGPSARVGYDRWLKARAGVARVVVGERGTVFHPVANLGLTIVVDEANPAFKERRSPRHHVREVALERARRTGGVGLLVGIVPSAPAWGLLASRRVQGVVADRSVERRLAPLVTVADERGGPRTAIASDSVRAIRGAVDAGEHAVILAARRGEGRVLVCGSCQKRVSCPNCAGSTSPDGRRLSCQLCGWQGMRRCRACGKERLVPLAAGTGRLAQEVARNVTVPVAVLEGYAPDSVPPPPSVLVMTRGAVLDHPPGRVGAVILADLDALLRRPLLDAAEDALRLAMQLATWVTSDDRQAAPGRSRVTDARVIVQTREPDHPVVRALQGWDPKGFWTSEQSAREALRFPPASAAIHLDVPSDVSLAQVLGPSLPAGDDLLGPLPAEGRHRYLVKTDDRLATLRAIAPIRREMSQANVDLRVDVDPVQVT
ncbi:MAG: primosomal protein N' (replication factor Y) [Glaciecola sp.]|jgi:primosomal protein N' (replication factor Y)